ncbi:sperm acrosome-associated protein 9-like [Ptychodera flava]|uniref:sperm acrosome-associated protein 9-like n=1 Tax=Ptychodera flava TaxID=63121 RepID=UPI003969F3DB
MSVSEIRRDIDRFRQRYKVLQQQQFTFVAAMDNSRTDSYERTKPVRSIATVKEYMHKCNNATDKRAMRQWLAFLQDLDDFRRKLEEMGSFNGPLAKAVDKWKLFLNPNNDFSRLRVRYPHQEVNHLSCDEARNYYGGAVSLIPSILDCMDIVQGQVAAHSALGTWPPKAEVKRKVYSAKHERSHTEGEMLPERSQTSMDKATDTKDASKKTTKATTKKPKKLSGDVAYFRRTLNGRADQIHVTGWGKKGVWRGASYDKINHVDHRHFVDLDGTYM